MMYYSFSFLVKIQFLGFRFHGWQKQKDVQTIHDMIDKTLSFVFGEEKYKTIGVGRTDAKVSANTYFFQMFVNHQIEEIVFLELFNRNTTADIKAIFIKNVPISFNIINYPKIKEYHYYFSFGEKNHPFAAPFMTESQENLNIHLMKKGAKLFEGTHYFHKYCTKPSVNTKFKRKIIACEIVENTLLTASFFPENSYVLKVKGKGFLRYQIRLMMAVLFELGKGNVSLNFIENSLKEDNDQQFLKVIAPASGLQLYDLELEGL